jgi:hypothetical protein
MEANSMEWVKLSQKMPPEPQALSGDGYLVTTDRGEVIPVLYVKASVRGKEILRWEWTGRICPWQVIAYMPFPPPFQEKPRSPSPH